MRSVLLAGESWISHTVHIKGVDWFQQAVYEEGTRWLKRALIAGGYRFQHIPNHLAAEHFPLDLSDLSQWNLLILSDIGANTLLLHPDVTGLSKPMPNRLALIKRYVEEGGALLMIGGYMSFGGIDGRARYSGTPVEHVLPVRIKDGDDRVEVPEGFRPRVVTPDHPVVRGLPEYLPVMLFYNGVTVREGADVLIEHEGSPILAVMEYGKGRSAAFTPDAAPHGAPPGFLDWDQFDQLFQQLADWLCAGKD